MESSPEGYDFHEQQWDSYEQLRAEFKWNIPNQFNIAQYVCDRWAEESDRVGVYTVDSTGEMVPHTFQELTRRANRLANYLRAQGVGPSDVVGVNLPQRAETIVSHLAAWKIGAVSLPLSVLFSQEGLSYRLADSGAKALVVDETNVEVYRQVEDRLPELDTVLILGDISPASEEVRFKSALSSHADRFRTRATNPEDDALIIYTSGTTRKPKGVLFGHQVLLGHLPAYLTSLANLTFTDDDLYWTPAEWAWVLFVHIVLGSLYYGKPVLARQFRRFAPKECYELIERAGVTNCMIPPTALRMLVQTREASEEHELSSMRVLAYGGEASGRELYESISEIFGDDIALHEMYGLTEADAVVGECTALVESQPDNMGPVQPGHEVRIVDPETAHPIGRNQVGEIAIRHDGDPVCFKEYLNKPDETAAVLRDGWLLTDDLGVKDDAGYLSYICRKDELIISSGYRVAPSEIEDILSEHDSVALVGVVGVPDDIRGEVPKAFIVLSEGFEPSQELKVNLKEMVKNKLAKYKYPRQIEFRESLPQTTTGKISRSDLKDLERD